MFLNKLLIRKGTGEIIRSISFRKGINFIVDETPAKETTTGNNVGKTTVLRLVDYCLGGSGENIYKDMEFKNKTNAELKNFLENITIKLELVEDIENENVYRIKIEKNFLKRKNKILKINGRTVAAKDFNDELKKKIFKKEDKKPTFRQIVAKNIRDEKNKMQNIVKVLHATTKVVEYEALYLFWFGVDTSKAEEKQQLEQDEKKTKNFQTTLREKGELSSIQQKLTYYERKIKILEEQKEQFNINPNYEKDVQTLNNLKDQISKIVTRLSKLKMRRTLIIESIDELNKELVNIDQSLIKNLYKKVGAFVSDIQVSFEDTVNFHNNLIKNKLDYITKELPDLDKNLIDLDNQLEKLRKDESILTTSLQKKGVLEDLEEIIKDLNNNYEKKGALEKLKELLEDSEQKLADIKSNLSKINKELDSKDEILQKNIACFNRHFTDISEKLYEESYILSSRKNDSDNYELLVDNIDSNPSTGKKKGQIAAFDFAYIKFADELNMPCLHFVMHDQLESLHGNQFRTLIEIANNMNGQYIVPILKDKIPNDVNIDNFKILSLSQNDKLFRL